MLTRLAIRDVVLIDQLDLDLDAGFAALTGETGAGKSILLDALGLALGGRSDQRLLRHGAEQAVVTAAFELPAGHAVLALLAERGLPAENPVLLRRVLGKDGRTRAFVNDQPAGVGLLREVGALLVEIQGQAEQHTLMDAATHRGVLDAFGGLTADAAALAGLWENWRGAAADLESFEAQAKAAATDEEYLRHALGELEKLDPKAGEEEKLAAERAALMQREKLVEAVNAALAELGGQRPVEAALRGARRALDRVAPKAAGRLDAALAALDRAEIEVAEAVRHVEAAGAGIEADAARLQGMDDRLFALRDLARKHRVGVGELPRLAEEIARRLAAIVDSGAERARRARRAAEAKAAYLAAAKALSEARAKAALRLDKAVAKELPPLKLEKAKFATRLEPLAESQWGPGGLERAGFEVATNPGVPPGPLARIASGGELSRFMLALKVVLARTGTAPTLVFDEVDSGIGGATAAAVGERLARLAKGVQVLAVTHSPQVAAKADAHWRVEKAGARTRIERLNAAARREEIARMLSGRAVTEEARKAAEALIAGAAA